MTFVHRGCADCAAVRHALAVLTVFLLATLAHAGSPEIRWIYPAGAQRGTQATFNIRGERLKDAEELMLYRPGMTVSKLEVKDDKNVAVTLDIAPDCPLGEHQLRLRTKSGITELQTYWIGALPVVREEEPNNDFASPQRTKLNVTLAGKVENEDVDYYAVEAKKGQRITAEVEAIRLGYGMFDAYVAILDSERFALATCDDSALLLQDPVASVVAPEDGTYIIEIREASYGGSGGAHYRLHVGTFPRPLVAYPAGGQAGTSADLRLLGDVAGTRGLGLPLPAHPVADFPIWFEQDGEISPSPVSFRVSPFANVMEAEPNHRSKATVYDGELPVAFNGVIHIPGDQDWFRFKAKKGQVFEVEAYARRLRSPLDAVINIFEAGGKHIAGNDDSRGPDPYLRFQAPADGAYELRVRDHLERGGPTFAYRVEFQERGPELSLTLPQFDRRNPQARQTVPVPRGNRYATLIRAQRSNFGGAIVVDPQNLPAGLSVDRDTMADNVNEVPVVFEAAPDAPLAGRLIDVQGRHADASKDIVGGFTHDIPLVRGNPNNTEYYNTQVDRLAVAVTEEVPFKINIAQPKAPIVQNGSMNLKVTAERKEGFDAPIQLYMLWNPPGISSSARVTMEKGKSEAVYPLNASDNAQPRAWKIAVIAQANTGYGPVWISTQLATLTVAEPFVTGTLELAAAEQGSEAGMLLKLEHNRAFAGEGELKLVGLPAKTTAEPTQIKPEQAEHVFTIQTEEGSPVGQHKSLFCELTVMVQGEPVVHRMAQGGVLRIDKPRVVKKEDPKPQPKQEAKKAEAKKPAPKPLTRLEQLRLEREKELQGK